MSGLTDRYAPPPPPGRLSAVSLAVLAHLGLVGALAWGVNWRDDPRQLSAEAEIWSATVQAAAPRAVEPPAPPPAPQPAPPAPVPPPPPAPVPAPPPPPPAPAPAPTPPAPDQAQIALERQKQREAEERRQRQQELERRQREEQQRLAEQKRRDAEQQRLAEQKKREAEQQRLAEQKRREAEQRRVAEQKQREAEQREREEQQRLAQLREENLRRIQGMAGATGGPTATGDAPRSAGPSQNYAGRIVGRVRPNIVFTDPFVGDPVAEVEVRLAPDGTITSRRIVKSSGLRSWDEAVLRALDRTEILPRDVDGRIYSPMIIEFRARG